MTKQFTNAAEGLKWLLDNPMRELLCKNGCMLRWNHCMLGFEMKQKGFDLWEDCSDFEKTCLPWTVVEEPKPTPLAVEQIKAAEWVYYVDPYDSAICSAGHQTDKGGLYALGIPCYATEADCRKAQEVE